MSEEDKEAVNDSDLWDKAWARYLEIVEEEGYERKPAPPVELRYKQCSI